MSSTDQAKQAVREQVWSRLEAVGVVEPGVAGSIPDFQGAAQAAERLAALAAWQQAHVVKTVPDRAQQPVRTLALTAGKVLYMAAPRLATAKPFYFLNPGTLAVPADEAADRAVAARVAPLVSTSEMKPIDLVVVSSVAVNSHGARLGKGAGYSDIEFGLLAEAGLISERTTIATTVHDLQVLDDDLPEQGHDFHVDLVVTPERVIRCDNPKRPTGIDWPALDAEKIAAIPALANMFDQLRSPRLGGAAHTHCKCPRADRILVDKQGHDELGAPE